MHEKRTFYWLLIVAMFSLAVFVAAPPAHAHPNHPHRTVGVRKHFHAHDAKGRRWRPNVMERTAEGYPAGTVCKTTGPDSVVKRALGGSKLFTLTQRVTWCYVPGERGFVSYTVSDSVHTEAYAHWNFQSYTEQVRDSVRPWQYRYSRTRGEWRFELPWPIPFGFVNSVYICHTVRTDGTMKFGWGPQ